MIKFFRTIRQNLLNEGKTSRYFKYAIGEIILVVIGILIALSINNWNENNKNAKRENAFLINLQEDLKADSLILKSIENKLQTAVLYKNVFENYLEGKPTDKDSINDHLIKQYNMLVEFIPNANTMDELKNGDGLNLISNPVLRRKIVNLYNNYDQLILRLEIGRTKGQTIINYVSQRVENINKPTSEEISHLLEDNYYVNQTRMNYLVTQLEAVGKSLQ